MSSKKNQTIELFSASFENIVEFKDKLRSNSFSIWILQSIALIE